MNSLSNISFDKFIEFISFIKFTGEIPSEFHTQYLKLYNDAKQKSGTKKLAALDKMLCVSESQSNTVSSLASSISNEHSNQYGMYLLNRHLAF